MKVYKGIQKIGILFENKHILIDFNELFLFREKRRLNRLFNQFMGLICLVFSLLFIFLMQISLNNEESLLLLFFDKTITSKELIIGFSLVILVYSLFLLEGKSQIRKKF